MSWVWQVVLVLNCIGLTLTDWNSDPMMAPAKKKSQGTTLVTTTHPDGDVNVGTELCASPSSRCWCWTGENFDPQPVLEEKLGDQGKSGAVVLLWPGMSAQNVIQYLLRYLGLDERGGLIHICCPRICATGIFWFELLQHAAFLSFIGLLTDFIHLFMSWSFQPLLEWRNGLKEQFARVNLWRPLLNRDTDKKMNISCSSAHKLFSDHCDLQSQLIVVLGVSTTDWKLMWPYSSFRFA